MISITKIFNEISEKSNDSKIIKRLISTAINSGLYSKEDIKQLKALRKHHNISDFLSDYSYITGISKFDLPAELLKYI